MEIYTIATEQRITSGHGENYMPLAIVRSGSYETDVFPPCFCSREQASDWLKTERKEGVVVTLDLINKTSS